ncbi:MAG: hypothetical protein K5756_01305 [Clostridiales bacterium]|nr:hypothetical protein [Clostridiales bacterium]
MRLRNKKWLILIVSVMFTLTISYFAVLSPTTAWFYTQSNKGYTFIFGDVDVDLPVSETVPVTVRLKAATRCADFGEENFDAAVYVAEIEAINTGTAAARVWFDPSLPDGKTKDGLYFFATCHKEGETNLPSIKEELEDMLTKKLTEKNVTPVDFNDEDYLTYEENVIKITGIAENYGIMEEYMNNAYVIVPPQSTSILRIAFWVEYNATINNQNVGNQFEINGTDTSLNIKEFNNLGIKILLTATQDGEGITKPTTAPQP